MSDVSTYNCCRLTTGRAAGSRIGHRSLALLRSRQTFADIHLEGWVLVFYVGEVITYLLSMHSKLSPSQSLVSEQVALGSAAIAVDAHATARQRAKNLAARRADISPAVR